MSKHNESFNGFGGVSRRDFLQTVLYTSPILMFGAGGLLAQEIKPLSPAKLIPKGQKVRAVQIGVFNRGGQVLDSFKPYTKDQIEYKAFADVAFAASGGKLNGVPCYRDYREMLEAIHEQIDAVIIATPDHSHFPMVMHAMLLGKHVYVEKPMAQNVYECRLLAKTAQACGVVTQMGNQGHSGSGTFQYKLWVEAGIIKNVKKIDAWMANSRRWHGFSYTAYPEEMAPVGYDWDQWLGRRPFRPYSSKLVDGNWRCWYDFGCGAMGDWGAHILDAAHRYLKLGQPYEISTRLMGPSDLYYPQGSVITFRFKEREGMPPLEMNWYDGQGNVPVAPAGYETKMGGVGSLVYMNDYIVRGTSHGADYVVIPDEKQKAMKTAGKLPEPPKKLPDHYQNFLNACQGIEPANSSFEVSAGLAELLCLGCIGQRFGGTLKYDAEKMEITNHPEANKMLKGPAVRAGWEAYDQQKPAPSKKAQILAPDKAPWEDLLEGNKLDKWFNPYEWGKAEVADGVVTLSSDKGKWFLLTQKEYANFEFEGEIKMPLNAGNSGFMFRCQQAKNRAWGYQAEVDTADRKWSGGLYDEGRRKWFASPNKDQAATEQEKNDSIAAFRARAGECYKQGEWNQYRIVCVGDHIQIYVNGTLTTDVHDEYDITGYIAIQHHGEAGLAYQFRNLRIKDLGAGGEIYYPHREEAAKKAKESTAVASTLEGDIYEAENAKMTNCVKATNQAGYQGAGFADFGDKGGTLEWDNVLSDKEAAWVLTFRYASSSDRPCDLFVNGQKIGKVPFASTGGFTTWKTVEMEAAFKNGGNSVKLVALGSGPNVDALAVKKQ